MRRHRWKYAVLLMSSGGLLLQAGCAAVVSQLALQLLPTIVTALVGQSAP